jgi:perosamine synthetase
LSEAEIAAVVDTLRSGWLTMGPKTQAFEQEFARFVGSPSAIAVNSATSGLHLAINALGIGPGDEVLVPTLTFASTAATVLHAGARPRLVDCEPDTLNIDVADAARQCGPRTKAIIPVHFAGHPCDMDEIQELARERGLSVVEDAAHALPASYRGRTIGTSSTATVFSFYATKNLTTGEGGMITTSDPALADRIRSRRLHGMTRDAWKRYTAEGTWRYDVAYPGFKYNMTDMNAALGLVQLERLASFQERRRAVVDRYRTALADIEEIELPVCRPYVEHAWHLFVVRVHHDRTRIHRDQVIAQLTEAGIGTSVHFIPLHVHSYYQETFRYKLSDLPNASKQWERIISLPLFPDMQDSDVDRVADALRTIFKENRR